MTYLDVGPCDTVILAVKRLKPKTRRRVKFCALFISQVGAIPGRPVLPNCDLFVIGSNVLLMLSWQGCRLSTFPTPIFKQ